MRIVWTYENPKKVVDSNEKIAKSAFDFLFHLSCYLDSDSIIHLQQLRCLCYPR